MWLKRNSKKRLLLIKQIVCEEIPKPFLANGLEIWSDRYTALYMKPLMDEHNFSPPPSVLFKLKRMSFDHKADLPRIDDERFSSRKPVAMRIHPDIYVNSKYLLRIMKIFPEAKTFSWTGRKDEPIFIGGKDGYAILFPLNYEKAKKRETA